MYYIIIILTMKLSRSNIGRHQRVAFGAALNWIKRLSPMVHKNVSVDAHTIS